MPKHALRDTPKRNNCGFGKRSRPRPSFPCACRSAFFSLFVMEKISFEIRRLEPPSFWFGGTGCCLCILLVFSSLMSPPSSSFFFFFCFLCLSPFVFCAVVRVRAERQHGVLRVANGDARSRRRPPQRAGEHEQETRHANQESVLFFFSKYHYYEAK